MPAPTRDDLLENLRQQMSFLQRSADLYDQRHVDEALRLAVSLRVLLHDTKNSTSLLTHLGEKLDLRFATTGEISPGASRSFSGAVLAPMRIGGDAQSGHVARLHEAPRGNDQGFSDWWNARIIGAGGVFYTRKDVALALANQDGGAHVGRTMTRKYADLRSGLVGWVIRDAMGQVVAPTNPALPTVRQIAFEAEVTVHGQLAKLFR